MFKTAAPDADFHGHQAAARLPNTTFFSYAEMNAETLQIAFDLQKIAVSAGSACSSGKVGPSHVLKAMGVDGTGGAIRVSVSLENSERDIDCFGEALATIMSRRKNQT